jgi:cytochrome b
MVNGLPNKAPSPAVQKQALVQARVQAWVWDVSIRVAHGLLALCFATAYATGDSERWRLCHVCSGSAVLGIVGYRIVWGVIGSPQARFASFVRSPRAAAAYLCSLLSPQPVHFLGHNPAGGWAVLALLSLSGASALTGGLIYRGNSARWLETSHALLANMAVLMIAAHVLAVLVSSALHAENLPKAMVLGYKDSPEQALQSTPHPRFSWLLNAGGLALLMLAIALAISWVQS